MAKRMSDSAREGDVLRPSGSLRGSPQPWAIIIGSDRLSSLGYHYGMPTGGYTLLDWPIAGYGPIQVKVDVRHTMTAGERAK